MKDYSELLSQAQSLYKKSSYRESLKLCESIYIIRPSDTDNLILLGAIHFQLRNLSESIFYSQQCLRVDQTCAEAYVTIGNCMSEMGELDAAMDFFHKAIRFQPRFPDAYNNLACALFKLGKITEAIDTLNVAITLDNSYCDAICNLANVFKVIGKPNDAKNKYLDAIRIDPKCAIAWSNLGGIFYDNGDFAQAVKCYQQALVISPHFADAYSNMGNALVQLGKLQSLNDDSNTYFVNARKQYLQAQKLRPDFALAVGNLGLLEMTCNGFTKDSSSSYKAAKQLLRKALLQDPNYYDALNNLAVYFFEQGQFEDCIKLFLRVLRRKPDHYCVYHNLAKVLKAKRLYSLSAFAFKVADVLKEMPATKSGLASLWLESGKVNKALDVLNNYAELFEERRQKALLYHNLGVANAMLTNTKEAKRYLTHQQVCEWENRAVTLYNLSILCQRQGDLNSALKYSQALCTTNDNPTYQYTKRLKVLLDEAICNWERSANSPSSSCSRRIHFGQLGQKCSFRTYHRDLESMQKTDSKRIRIGYIYDSLSRSNVMEIPNMHDKTMFDVKHYPIRYRQTHGIAKRIYQDMIQILVLLDESTSHVFQEIFSVRPACIQISFDNSFHEGVDYFVRRAAAGDVLEDSQVLPLASPYINNDLLAAVPNRTSESVSDIRSKYGISDDCFVYASFCLPFHIDEDTFKMWMNILKIASDSAILLLMKYNDHMECNLKNKAESLHVDPNRIVFIEPMITNHFEKYFLADLYLDTTTMDGGDSLCDEALLLGTPTLCFQQSKEAATTTTITTTAVFMRDLGLGDQVVSTSSEYEKLAVQLEYDEEKYIDIVKILDEEKKAKRGIFDYQLRSNWISKYEAILALKAGEFYS